MNFGSPRVVQRTTQHSDVDEHRTMLKDIAVVVLNHSWCGCRIFVCGWADRIPDLGGPHLALLNIALRKAKKARHLASVVTRDRVDRM